MPETVDSTETRRSVEDALDEITALLRRLRLVEGLVHDQLEHAEGSDGETYRRELSDSQVVRQNREELQRHLDRLHPAEPVRGR